jgi:DHA2 family multidrug resistance protein
LARIIQASGIAFLFVPINTIAYAYLPPGKNNDASGLVNLARNIGGSVGIAFATTMISRRAQLHQNILSAHTSPYDPQFTTTLASIKQALVAHGMSTVEAGQRAAAMVYATLQQQASLLSYVDVFRIMAMVFLAVIPFALLARKIQPGKVAVGH